MNRSVVGIIGGALVGLILASIMSWGADYVFSPSIAADMNPELGRTAHMPIMGVIVKLLGWGGGAFLGGLMAVRSAEETGWPAWIVGGVLLLAAVGFHFAFPHPIWFLILRLLFVAGAAFVAGRLWSLTPAEA
jgi:hypothetical protein